MLCYLALTLLKLLHVVQHTTLFDTSLIWDMLQNPRWRTFSGTRRLPVVGRIFVRLPKQPLHKRSCTLGMVLTLQAFRMPSFLLTDHLFAWLSVKHVYYCLCHSSCSG